jgi:hypothetical protein
MAGRISGSLRPHPTVLAAAACVALAAWTSLGAVAVTSTTSATPRLGILPPPWLLAVLVAAGFVALRRLPPRHTLPLFITGLLLLPWLPLPVPAAATIWTGPLGSWVWVVAAVGFVSAALPRSTRRVRAPSWTWRPRGTSPTT